MRHLPAGLAVFTVLALAAGGCSSDSSSSPAGTGGSAGSAASGGAAGTASGGAPSGGAPSGGGGSGGAPSGGTSGGGGASGAGGTSGMGGVWQPKPGTSWQWQLTGTIDQSVDVAMYDIDLFDATASVIAALHAKGRTVICYFSAGSREDWRPDAASFSASDYGNPLQGWAGENWLDVRSANVRAIMKQRLDLAVSKKCDGVEPDNVDGYQADTGFPLSESDQIDYDQFLANEGHARGLSVGLKNTLDLVPTLMPSFDWALNEECLSYSECNKLGPFLAANKAVFHVEYVSQESDGAAKLAAVCSDPTISGFSTLIKLQDLGAWRLAC